MIKSRPDPPGSFVDTASRRKRAGSSRARAVSVGAVRGAQTGEPALGIREMTTVVPLRERPDLCDFFARRFESEWSSWYGPGGRGDAAADLRAFANPGGDLPVAVVALDDFGSAVGIAALRATSIDSYAHVGPWASAGYVIPERRRQGIGASLLSALLVEARRLGFHTIYCATASAVRLLEREGWSRIDTVMRDGSTQFIFSRTVPATVASKPRRDDSHGARCVGLGGDCAGS